MTLLKTRREPLVVPASALARNKRTGKVVNLLKLGLIPQIAGGSPSGTNIEGDVVTQTLDGRDLNQIWSEFQQVLTLYNEERNRLLAILTYDVQNPIEDVFQGGDTVEFEKASEFGVPRGIRTAAPSYFSLGFSFDWWDLAIRYTWKFLAESRAEQVDALQNMALEADNRLLFREVMGTIFSNTGRVATIAGQNFNVFPFYNGDATVPPRWKNTVHTAPHTHYLVSGGATVDFGDLNDMENHLKHHGYSWQNGTALMLLVNSAQSVTIQGFRVAGGAPYDFIPAVGGPSWIPPEKRMEDAYGPGAFPASTFRGLPVIGRYGPWLVIEDDLIPAGYMLGLASGGDLSAANPVGIREHANPSLRGLRLVKGPDPNYPLIDSYYQRGFGTGIRQRGAGVVMQIKASGSYDIPVTYTLDWERG